MAMVQSFILLADDDEVNRFLFAEALNRAYTAFKIQLIKKRDFLLEFLIKPATYPYMILMYGEEILMYGEERLAELKKDQNTRDNPIIHSAFYIEETPQMLKEKRAQLFLQKPSSSSGLKSKPKKCISLVVDVSGDPKGISQYFIN